MTRHSHWKCFHVSTIQRVHHKSVSKLSPL
jgi:hypothetical protein